jgi:hypothetical protein
MFVLPTEDGALPCWPLARRPAAASAGSGFRITTEGLRPGGMFLEKGREPVEADGDDDDNPSALLLERLTRCWCCW